MLLIQYVKMKKTILFILIISILLISGCYELQSQSTQPKEEIKEISISGVDKEQEISSDIPVNLTIRGVRNKVTIKENTSVNKITISGVDITIYLPEGTYPEISDSGVRTKIEYY